MSLDDDESEVADGGDRRPRSFWSGTLTFGLVSIPVALYPAARPGGIHLRMLSSDGEPLRRRYYCPEDERMLDEDELIRGYELEDGGYVPVSDAELEALAPEKSSEIVLREFVGVDELDPIFVRRSYFLAPARDANRPYRLLAATMEQAGRAGIATFVMRGHEHLVAITAENGIMRADALRFQDEIRSAEAVGLPDSEQVAPRELARMKRRIQRLEAGELPLQELVDPRVAAIRDLAEEKAERGEDVIEIGEHVESAGAQVVDLMEVLKRQLGASAQAVAQGRASGAPRPRGPPHEPARSSDRAKARRGPAHGNLRALSKQELYERAKRFDIAGRSRMSKDELVRAIQRVR